MKRKRGVGRRKPTKKANVAGADKETENFMASNAGDHSGWSDAANDAVHTRIEVEKAQANTTTSRGPTAGFNHENSNEKTCRGNSWHPNNVFKDVASFAAKLSRAVGSSTSDPCIDARPLQDETTNAGEQMFSHQDPLGNKKELNAALSVIKTIMKMDAAKPFNSPVDPVALGIPGHSVKRGHARTEKVRSSFTIDYFDMIDTPMDFDTVCNNIDLGFKYKNSKDIYRDVELIWDNCSKYNKEGTKIMELMKRVSTKFLKLWSAAGLYIQRKEPSNVHLEKSLLHIAEDGVRHNHYRNTHLDGSMISNSIHQGNPCLMGQELRQPHPSCYSYECRPPQISSQCSCSWCFRGSQSSMHHNFWHMSPGGMAGTSEKHYNERQFEISSQHELSHQPPPNRTLQCQERCCQHQPSSNQHQAFLQKARMNSQNPGSSNAYSNQQKQWQMSSSHVDGYQPALTHANELQHHSNLTQFPCNEPDVPSMYRAGHPHLNPPMESIVRHTKCTQEDLIDLDPDGPSLQKHQRVVAAQVQSSSMGVDHSRQPQEKSFQRQLDSCSRKLPLARDEENTGRAGGQFHVTPAGESSARRATCRLESSVAPATNTCSSDEYQMDQNELESPLTDESAMNVPEEDGHGSQPGSSPAEASPLENQHTTRNGDSTALLRKTRGRGPTRCLNLMFQGKKIPITTNELGQPVGVDARKLVSFLGILARDGHMAPLNYIDWRAMPEVHKENMWKEVQNKFIIDPKSRYWIMKSLSKKWKDFKARLKIDHFLPHATNEERLADRDERVLPDQWDYLVSHWNSELAEKRSAINKACSAKLVLRHAVGRKSFARIREEQRQKKPDKKPPSRAELFILTRMRKDGKPINEATSAIIEQLRQNQDTAQASAVQDEAFVQLVGRRKDGRVRCVELGSSPSELGSKLRTQAVADQMAPEANGEVREIKNRMGAMEETCAQMAAQMAAMMSMMSSLQKNLSSGNVPEPALNTSGTCEELPQKQQVNSTPTTRSSRKKGI